jgi:hypothetical protein
MAQRTNPLFSTERGKRHRLVMTNKSGDNHPVHLPPQLLKSPVGDKPTAGVAKDTVNMTRFSTVEIDFVADDPGPTLLHCHHQDHQDEGFMGMMTISELILRRSSPIASQPASSPWSAGNNIDGCTLYRPLAGSIRTTPNAASASSLGVAVQVLHCTIMPVKT